jgi:hypothetical protein
LQHLPRHWPVDWLWYRKELVTTPSTEFTIDMERNCCTPSQASTPIQVSTQLVPCLGKVRRAHGKHWRVIHKKEKRCYTYTTTHSLQLILHPNSLHILSVSLSFYKYICHCVW